MPNNAGKKARLRLVLRRVPEVLDVQMTAALLMVSRDTVYDLFASGELPGRRWDADGSPPRLPFCSGFRAGSHGQCRAVRGPFP
jgi:hypothetical protein